MPIIKISLTDEECNILAEENTERMSIQDFIRYKLFQTKKSSIFSPEEAEKRALGKYSKGDKFSLPDIYSDEWNQLEGRMTGIFGRRFFDYLESKDSKIKFVEMSPRRAIYTIK